MFLLVFTKVKAYQLSNTCAFCASKRFVFESPLAQTEPSEKSLIDESHHGTVFGHAKLNRLLKKGHCITLSLYCLVPVVIVRRILDALPKKLSHAPCQEEEICNPEKYGKAELAAGPPLSVLAERPGRA